MLERRCKLGTRSSSSGSSSSSDRWIGRVNVVKNLNKQGKKLYLFL